MNQIFALKVMIIFFPKIGAELNPINYNSSIRIQFFWGKKHLYLSKSIMKIWQIVVHVYIEWTQ